MGSLLSILGIVLLLGTVYLALKNYISRSPLDNIPGPPSAHWLHGKETSHRSLVRTLIFDNHHRELQAILLSHRMGLLFPSQPQLWPGCEVSRDARSTERLLRLRHIEAHLLAHRLDVSTYTTLWHWPVLLLKTSTSTKRRQSF